MTHQRSLPVPQLSSKKPAANMPERPIVFSKIILLIVVMLPTSLVAQSLPLSHFQHTAWTLQDGAPSQIDALAQTKDGYIWLGTVNTTVL